MAGFRFKQFAIEQENTAMKVNTDGVLLGAWMDISKSDRKFLDIGTGTGVIALMCAQRVMELHNASCKSTLALDNDQEPFTITGLEIESGAYTDACSNVASSPWPWVDIQNVPLQEFERENDCSEYDFIFSNPPYFINSLKCSSGSKSVAKHTDPLSQMDLLNNVLRLLADGGRFALILPVNEAKEFMRKAEFVGRGGNKTLVLSRCCEVSTVAGKPPKRLLMEYNKCYLGDISKVINEKLVIYEDSSYSKNFKYMLQHFYLNL